MTDATISQQEFAALRLKLKYGTISSAEFARYRAWAMSEQTNNTVQANQVRKGIDFCGISRDAAYRAALWALRFVAIAAALWMLPIAAGVVGSLLDSIQVGISESVANIWNNTVQTIASMVGTWMGAWMQRTQNLIAPSGVALLGLWASSANIRHLVGNSARCAAAATM